MAKITVELRRTDAVMFGVLLPSDDEGFTKSWLQILEDAENRPQDFLQVIPQARRMVQVVAPTDRRSAMGMYLATLGKVKSICPVAALKPIPQERAGAITTHKKMYPADRPPVWLPLTGEIEELPYTAAEMERERARIRKETYLRGIF